MTVSTSLGRLARLLQPLQPVRPKLMAMIVPSPYAESLARLPVRAHTRSVLGSDTRFWEYGSADADRHGPRFPW